MEKDVQDTSLEAYYEDVLPNIGDRQRTVFNAIMELKEATDAELAVFLGLDNRSVAPRRNELMHMNRVIQVDKRKCKITGKTAKVWSVNNEVS